MSRMQSRTLSAAEEFEVWTRWKRGESVLAIGRALDRRPTVMARYVARHGGIPPPVRCRSARVLRAAEREEISRGLAGQASYRVIARALGRAPSTVSREVRRHGGRAGYRARDADAAAWRAARRPKRCRLATSPALQRVVASKLLLDWSPEQIAGWLRVTYAGDPTMQVSHETIYRSLFIQSRGVLKKALLQHLRRPRATRRSRRATTRGQGRGHIVEAVSIRERPAAVDDRAIPGHWEGDLLLGARHSQIATLVERQSRYVLLVRVPNRATTTVVRALARTVRTLPRALRASLTWDRGLELAAHRTFTLATNVQVYFCDPQSPWQRGTHEHTNGLLRQYFPKRTDLSGVSQRQLHAIARRLNQRPRKTLGYHTPADKLAAIVASTG